MQTDFSLFRVPFSLSGKVAPCEELTSVLVWEYREEMFSTRSAPETRRSHGGSCFSSPSGDALTYASLVVLLAARYGRATGESVCRMIVAGCQIWRVQGRLASMAPMLAATVSVTRTHRRSAMLAEVKAGLSGVEDRLTRSTTSTSSPTRSTAPLGPAQAYCPKTGLSVRRISRVEVPNTARTYEGTCRSSCDPWLADHIAVCLLRPCYRLQGPRSSSGNVLYETSIARTPPAIDLIVTVSLTWTYGQQAPISICSRVSRVPKSNDPLTNHPHRKPLALSRRLRERLVETLL